MKGAWRRLRAWLFREGRYPDKDVTADIGFLRAYAERTNAAAAPVPFDIEHGPTEGVLDFAKVEPGSLRVEYGKPPDAPDHELGHWITGEVSIDPAVDERLKARGLSVYLDLNNQRIEKVAVTKSPRVAGAAFADDTQETLLMSGGLLGGRAFSAETDNPQGSQTEGTPPDGDTPTTDAPAGAISWLRGVLGLGTGEEAPASDLALASAAQPAGNSPGQEAAISDQAYFSDPRTKALAALFESRIQAAEAKASAALSGTQAQVIEAKTAEFTAAGIPPWIVNTLVPLAYGQPKVTVAFTDDNGQAATREVDASGACRHVLEGLRAARGVPMSRLLPADDRRDAGHASFDDRVATEVRKRVAAMTAEGKTPNVALVQDVVLAEFSAQEGQ